MLVLSGLPPGDRHCACADYKGSLYVVIYRCRNRSSFIYKFQSGWNDRGNFEVMMEKLGDSWNVGILIFLVFLGIIVALMTRVAWFCRLRKMGR